MKKYNLLVSYTGISHITFVLPRYGELKLETDKPVLIKNAPVRVIEALKSLVMNGVKIELNPKQTSAPKVIDYDTLKTKLEREIDKRRPRSVLSMQPVRVEPILEESGEILEVDDTKLEDYIIPVGRYKGKTLSEVDSLGKLDTVYNNSNVEVQEKITSYYEKVGE